MPKLTFNTIAVEAETLKGKRIYRQKLFNGISKVLRNCKTKEEDKKLNMKKK